MSGLFDMRPDVRAQVQRLRLRERYWVLYVPLLGWIAMVFPLVLPIPLGPIALSLAWDRIEFFPCYKRGRQHIGKPATRQVGFPLGWIVNCFWNFADIFTFGLRPLFQLAMLHSKMRRKDFLLARDEPLQWLGKWLLVGNVGFLLAYVACPGFYFERVIGGIEDHLGGAPERLPNAAAPLARAAVEAPMPLLAGAPAYIPEPAVPMMLPADGAAEVYELEPYDPLARVSRGAGPPPLPARRRVAEAPRPWSCDPPARVLESAGSTACAVERAPAAVAADVPFTFVRSPHELAALVRTTPMLLFTRCLIDEPVAEEEFRRRVLPACAADMRSAGLAGVLASVPRGFPGAADPWRRFELSAGGREGCFLLRRGRVVGKRLLPSPATWQPYLAAARELLRTAHGR